MALAIFKYLTFKLVFSNLKTYYSLSYAVLSLAYIVYMHSSN